MLYTMVVSVLYAVHVGCSQCDGGRLSLAISDIYNCIICSWQLPLATACGIKSQQTRNRLLTVFQAAPTAGCFFPDTVNGSTCTCHHRRCSSHNWEPTGSLDAVRNGTNGIPHTRHTVRSYLNQFVLIT